MRARRLLRPLVGAFALAAAVLPATEAARRPPNVVFILADDLGWRDLRCYGNDLVDTPNLDALARSGLRFTQGYAYPTCSPTRVSLMTGDYPSRHGMAVHINPHRRGWEKLDLPATPHALATSAFSLADLVTQRGYAATLIGKWHLGYGENPHNLDRVTMPPGLGPKTPRVAFGFEAPPSVKSPGIGAAYEARLQAFARENPGKKLGPQTLQAVRFLEQHRDGPFFCFLSYSAVHVPVEVRKDLETKYWQRTVARNALQDPRYLGLIEATDESVGLVLAALDELKLADHTVVIFASDNGAIIQDFYGSGAIVSVNEPLRSQKGSVLEGGIRVPWIVRWPGVVAPGAESAEPILTTDLMPTLAEITGAPLPSGYSGDGRSFVPVLRHPEAPRPERTLFWHQPAYMHISVSPSTAVRSGNHKLVEFLQDGHVELFDLAADPGERHDLAAAQPALVADLKARLYRWRDTVHAEMPKPNPHYDPARAQLWTIRPDRPWDPAPLEERRDLPDRYAVRVGGG
jgi:uncharacterized sulfatase